MKTSNKLLIGLGSLLLIAILILMISFRVMLTKCVDKNEYSGDVVAIEKELSGFSKIDLRKLDNVTITKGDLFSVSIIAPSDLSEKIHCNVKKDRLLVESPSSYAGKRVDIQITTPHLKEVTNIDVDYVSISDFKEKSLNLEFLGGSRVDGFDNVIEHLKIKSTGASQIDFMESEIENSNINIIGGGKIKIHMTGGVLKGKIMGAASIEYSGEAIQELHTTGAVKIRQR